MKRRHGNINNEILMEKRVRRFDCKAAVAGIISVTGTEQVRPQWSSHVVLHFSRLRHTLLSDGVRGRKRSVVTHAGKLGQYTGTGGLSLDTSEVLFSGSD